MDALQHALAGSLVADALPFTRRLGRKAQIAAILAGMAPDLDLAIPFILNFPPKSFNFEGMFSQRLALMFHRTYTHSFFYTLLAAFVLSFPLRRWLGGKSGGGSWWQWGLLVWLAFVSHILLDIVNPWEVFCWLPFSSAGVAWTLMPLQDPTFIGLLALSFAANQVLRDPYAAYDDPRPVLPPWREKTSSVLDRLIGVSPLAWIIVVLLALRVWLTTQGVFPYPIIYS